MFHRKNILLLTALIVAVTLSGCTAPVGSASVSTPLPQPEVSTPAVSLPAEPEVSVEQPELPPSVSQPVQPEPEPPAPEVTPEPCQHATTKTVTVQPATCTAQGHTNAVCAACGETVASGTIPPTGHDYKTTVTEATCQTAGSRTDTCSRCGNVQTETIPAKDHSWSAATCGTAPTCGVCGTVSLTVTDHSWVVKHTMGKPECEHCGTQYTFDKLAFRSNTLNVPLLAGTKRITILDMQVDVRAFEGPFNTNSACRVDITVEGMASNACTLTRGSHLIAEDGTKINSIYENHGTTNPVCDGTFQELFSFDIPSCQGTYTVVFSAQ